MRIKEWVLKTMIKGGMKDFLPRQMAAGWLLTACCALYAQPNLHQPSEDQYQQDPHHHQDSQDLQDPQDLQNLQAEVAERPTMVPPFDFPLTLSGNFGELRSNHFHGGLDFKTGGVVGKPVRALADGYISRIRVTNGSGYVLDVHYDNGYHTVNRHLDGFMPAIAQRVEMLQYDSESWEVEIVPEPDEYPVRRGEQIAWSGNTGYSFGPHLHLDLFETESGDYVDPMPFFASKIKDTRAPKASGLMVFPQLGRGVVDGQQKPKAVALDRQTPVQAWGLIGVGIKAYDYMDGVHNHYGVYSVVLEVDGEEVFRSTVDRFSQEENRMINSWTYGSYMKSFVEPGNRLRMLQAANGQRGLICIDEERDYRFVYTLSDVFGNVSKCRFTVRGRKQPVPAVDRLDRSFLAWDRVNVLQDPGFHLVIPRGMLYDDCLLSRSLKTDIGAVAHTYQVSSRPVPLHGAAKLRIALRNRPVEDSTKYYVARVNAKGRKYSVGGRYEDGALVASVRELGTFTVAVDTVPPQITAVGKQQWAKNRKVVFRLKDKETGIVSYRGTIDGEFALFGRPNIVQSVWECKLDEKRWPRRGKHVVELTATDACGNTSVVRETFVW